MKWENFKQKEHWNFDDEEDMARKEMFAGSDASINEHNGNKSRPFNLIHNEFSVMTAEEKAAFLGLKPEMTTRASIWTPGVGNRNLPKSLDYRSDDCLQEVKNQKSCGSCWAFTAIAPLEFSRCRKRDNRKVLLSEQQLVDCDKANGGCNGGWYTTAWKYLENGSNAHKKYGLYTAKDGKCVAKSSYNRATVKSYKWVDANPDAMMEALQSGPLAVAIHATDELTKYSSGVYSSDECDKQINHGVVIVGYGSMCNEDYWIVRNSWGKNWGIGGYVFFKRGVNMCRIEAYACTVEAN